MYDILNMAIQDNVLGQLKQVHQTNEKSKTDNSLAVVKHFVRCFSHLASLQTKI